MTILSPAPVPATPRIKVTDTMAAFLPFSLIGVGLKARAASQHRPCGPPIPALASPGCPRVASGIPVEVVVRKRAVMV